jgi:L-aminopeptidase/D-esterase-like protein/GNAT superfamily N-acetyltransferase
MPQARPRDAITDVPGIRVGHWTDRRGATGCTVVLCPPEGAIAACAVLGGAPGTRETDALAPGNLVQRAHAVLLTGGSAFGLDAATGVMRWLEERGIGFAVRGLRVPIVPAAVIFDLGIGDPAARPDAAAGYAACEAAGVAVAQGSVGAGTGATVAKLAGCPLKGGLGTASEPLADGAVVGAIVVVNAVGEIVDPDTGAVVAPARRPDGHRVDPYEHLRGRPVPAPAAVAPAENTTIAVVATDLPLTHDQLLRVALMAHTGLARAIRPSHTPADGDTVFALATGSAAGATVDLMAVGALAARALERAVLKGVRAATSLAGVPGLGSRPRVLPLRDADRPWVEAFIAREWGAPEVVAGGVVYRPAELAGFKAVSEGQRVGLVTLRVDGEACEVVTLNSLLPGAGTALLQAAERYARARGCARLRLITTNDNLDALRFFQRRGLCIAAVYPGAVEAARRLKPQIPPTGAHGIPIRDEIELVKEL